MRYVLIILIVLLSALFMCGISVQLHIVSAEVDMLLVAMCLMILFERRLVPALYASIGGLAMDALFARGLGFYTLPYVLTGIAVFFYAEANRPSGIWHSCLVCAGAYAVKEIFSALLCIFLGYQFDIPRRLVTVVLPGIAVQAVFCFLVYFIYKWLYSFTFMQPAHDPEYKLLNRRRRRRY